jgi:5-formaminoimidazole-4-carboxamide-1-beta-D-ribofuranosyl 5'-monophosphate synthetase
LYYCGEWHWFLDAVLFRQVFFLHFFPDRMLDTVQLIGMPVIFEKNISLRKILPKKHSLKIEAPLFKFTSI